MKFFRKIDATQPRGNKKSVPQKIKPFIMTALVVVSSFIAMFSPFIADQAFAVTPDDVLNRARAWSILNAIIDARSDMSSSISLQDVDSCKFFTDNSAVEVGPHVTGNPDDGGESWDQMTNNTGNANAALNSVGISGCRDLLQKIGYTYGSGSVMNQPNNFGNTLSANIKKALIPNAFFGANIGDDSPGAALTYAMLYSDLLGPCGWQYRNSFTDNSTPDNQSRNQEAAANGHTGDNVGSHYYTYTYENGKAGNNTYYKNGGREDTVYIGSTAGFGPPTTGVNYATSSCSGDTANGIPSFLADHHSFADAYAALLKPGSQYTPGSCSERYTNADEQNACDAGYKNKANSSFCQNTYGTIANLLAACKYGRDTATGGIGVVTPPPSSGNNDSSASTTKPTCVIQTIGWIVCPVVNFLAQIVDAAYSIVASLLTVQPLLSTSGNGASPVYTAWGVMRNFANVVFVIIFLFVIFSQVTNIGITNYGIKKLLPKLVVIAVLVNGSFWISAAAIDVSNITGNSFDALFKGLQASVTPPDLSASNASTGHGWAGIAGGILAGTLAAHTALWIGLSALLPMLIVVGLTIVVTFLMLTLRQALLLLLVVVSPLLFVAKLLPGTEKMADDGLKLGRVLLEMYPAISIIFGASALASTIVINSSTSLPVQIMGAGIGIIPLIIVPTFIQSAHNVLSKFSNKLPSQTLQGKLMKKAGDQRERQEGRRALRSFNGQRNFSFGKYKRDAKRQAIDAGIKSSLGRAQQQYIAQKAQSSNAFANKVAGGTALFKASQVDLQRALANAQFTIEKAEAEEVQAEHATIDTLGRNELHDIIKNVNGQYTPAQIAAAIERTVQQGDIKGIEEAVNRYGNNTDNAVINRSMADALGKNGPGFLKASDVDNIRRGQMGASDGKGGTIASSMAKMASDNIDSGVYSQEKMVNASNDELIYASHNTTTAGNAKLQQTATDLKNNATLNGKIKHNAQSIDDIERTGRTTKTP